MFNKNKQLRIHFTETEVFLKSSFVERCQKNIHETIKQYFLLRKQFGACCKIHKVAWGLGFKFLLEVPLRRQCDLDPTDKLVLRRRMGKSVSLLAGTYLPWSTQDQTFWLLCNTSSQKPGDARVPSKGQRRESPKTATQQCCLLRAFIQLGERPTSKEGRRESLSLVSAFVPWPLFL